MFWKSVCIAVFAFLVCLCASDVNAQALQSTKARQAILIENTTGTVLLQKDADSQMPTSSMSKVMTVYMVFEALKEGRLSLNDKLSVSEKAWKKGGSKMFVGLGKKVSVEDLLRGVIIQSGNDATIVLAEGISGTEEVFAASMTAQAHAMGMKNSQFTNASGWPDPQHYSTARDLATLAMHLIKDYPERYHYFSEKSFTYSDIKQNNRNTLLYRNLGVDGIKTGHTEAGGYGLMSSAVRNGRRLTLVINGLGSDKERADESARLLEWGFRTFYNDTIMQKGDTVDKAPVWLGIADEVPLVVDKDIILTLSKSDRNKMKVTVAYEGPLPAPVKKGEKVGVLTIDVPGFDRKTYALLTGGNVSELGLFPKTIKKAKHFLFGQ